MQACAVAAQSAVLCWARKAGVRLCAGVARVGNGPHFRKFSVAGNGGAAVVWQFTCTCSVHQHGSFLVYKSTYGVHRVYLVQNAV